MSIINKKLGLLAVLFALISAGKLPAAFFESPDNSFRQFKNLLESALRSLLMVNLGFSAKNVFRIRLIFD